MSTKVEAWATQQAARELHDAKQSGITPSRQWHYGRAVFLLMAAGKSDEVPPMMAAGLQQTGAHGTQFVAGLRSAVTMLDGARGMEAMDEAANVEAWVEGDPLDPADRAAAAIGDEAAR